MYGMNVTYSVLRAKEIGFEPQVSLNEGLAASVKWAKEVGRQFKMATPLAQG
jgi:hypothetical protein